MTLQDIIDSLSQLAANPNVIIKVGLVLLMLMFLLFALVIARQISILTKLVNQVTFSPIFKVIAYGLVVTTLGLLIVTIFV